MQHTTRSSCNAIISPTVAPTSSNAQRSWGRAGASRKPLRVQALFGWGKRNEAEDEKKAIKEEQFRIQQDLLEARRTGSAIKDASIRRQKVQSTLADRKAARQEEKDSLAKGIIPDSLKNWKNYKKKEDQGAGLGGIIVPLLPFGLKEFDEGERFDLRSPYADDGWVDPEETDMWAGLKKIKTKILNFSGNNDVFDAEYSKPILWARDYNKMQQEKERKEKENKGGKKK